MWPSGFNGLLSRSGSFHFLKPLRGGVPELGLVRTCTMSQSGFSGLLSMSSRLPFFGFVFIEAKFDWKHWFQVAGTAFNMASSICFQWVVDFLLWSNLCEAELSKSLMVQRATAKWTLKENGWSQIESSGFKLKANICFQCEVNLLWSDLCEAEFAKCLIVERAKGNWTLKENGRSQIESSGFKVKAKRFQSNLACEKACQVLFCFLCVIFQFLVSFFFQSLCFHLLKLQPLSIQHLRSALCFQSVVTFFWLASSGESTHCCQLETNSFNLASMDCFQWLVRCTFSAFLFLMAIDWYFGWASSFVLSMDEGTCYNLAWISCIHCPVRMLSFAFAITGGLNGGWRLG